MKQDSKVSKAVIRRLPRYLRVLDEMDKEGMERVSSGELSTKIGYTASQIRQDFNHFGDFGQQGYGYNIKSLINEIRAILGLDRDYKIAVVGCGRLGHAVATFTNSFERNFFITAIFDVDENIIGEEILGVKVQHADKTLSYLKAHPADIGVITVPKEAAQQAADILVEAGVKAIWNFAPTDLKVPEDFPVNDVHLYDGLQSLVYYINH